jgi:hypothetical protein
MLFGSLLISGAALALAAMIAQRVRGQIATSTAALRQTRGMLQPALLTVRSQAERSGAIRVPGID